MCAAIDFKGTIICGHRHQDCFIILENLLEKNKISYKPPCREQEGFLTSENRFVDRVEAFKIAVASKQIEWNQDPAKYYGESILFSENLY